MQDDVALHIIVSPAGKGRYAAQLGERVLVESARCPLLESARVLLAEDHDFETVLEMVHRGSPIVAMRGQLGKLAGLTVTENDRVGPIFSKYVPFSGPLAWIASRRSTVARYSPFLGSDAQ